MFRYERVRWSCLVITAFSLTLVGCSGRVDDSKRFGKTAKVSGTLKFAGNPVKEARVQFTSSATGAAVVGTVTDGAFVMADPVPVGDYKVMVLPPQEPAPDGSPYVPKEYSDIPEKYGDEIKSDLTATVKEGEENKFAFEMKP